MERFHFHEVHRVGELTTQTFNASAATASNSFVKPIPTTRRCLYLKLRRLLLLLAVSACTCFSVSAAEKVDLAAEQTEDYSYLMLRPPNTDNIFGLNIAKILNNFVIL